MSIIQRVDLNDVSKTHPGDWKYVSEGGASIVFSYQNPHHGAFTGTVLRLRKSANACDMVDRVKYEQLKELEDPSIIFHHAIISRLITPEYLPEFKSTRIDREWLEQLKVISEHERPQERRDKDSIDVVRQKPILATDLVGGNGWTVEIKPKWGFLPNLTHLSAETCGVKSRRCRFCIHTCYQVLQGNGTPNEYCPLDLFSGDAQRISHALRCLLKAWMCSNGTLNNLKIFVRGQRIDPKDFASLRFFLKSANGTDISIDNEVQLMEAFVDALLPLLTKTSLLRDLATLQRTLDPLDIEGLSSLIDLYCTRTSHGTTSLDQVLREPDWNEWEKFVDTYLDSSSQLSLDHRAPKPEHLRYYAMAYALSASFKDCSLMLRLGNLDKEDGIVVIDLDLKSMKRLGKWADLDRRLAASFEDDGSKECIEANHS